MAADAEAATVVGEKGGMVATVIALAAVTLLGGAAGAGLGVLQADRIATIATKRANEAPVATENALAWDTSTTVARLNPVIVNLAAPRGARIRLDTAMVFDVDAVDDVERMKATLANSMVAFLRTVSVGELTGASAFNYLRDDLNERAKVASGGTVSELLIETMILQ
ncbi:flagellar basal body-associated FliL family protein [Acuticoccus sp.]|uniref:flagellar basal body-associated FliL family protein n=1 Tax=Acuticoccus sp. TaxID=1904378 RepID=UPI003B51C084